MNTQHQEMLSKISGARMLKTIQQLEEFGPRIAGTINDKKAREYIVACLLQYGLEVSTEEFPIMAFDSGSAQIKIIKPYEKEIPAFPFIRSISTSPGGVCAPLRYAGNISKNDITNSDLTDSVALVDPGSMDGVHQSIKLENAALHHAVGLIQYGSTQVEFVPSWGGPRWGTPIPAATIIHNDGRFLKNELENKKLEIKLEINTSLRKSTSANIIATLPGKKRKDEIIMVCAHHDTVISPGANDNGTGLSVALELAKLFAPQLCDRTLMFVFFGAEEGGDIGSKYFVEHYKKDLLMNIKALINLDMVGDGTKLCLVDKSRTADKWVVNTPWLNNFISDKAISLGYQVDKYINYSGTGDEAAFLEAGISASWLIKPDYPYIHTEEDKLERINQNDLKATAHLTGACLLTLSQGDLPIK